VRSSFVSGGYGPYSASNIAVATIRTRSVIEIPKRLMKVKNFRRRSTLTASLR
jgi:hypothetical protein